MTNRVRAAACAAGLASAVLTASVAVAASPETPRSGAYYEIWCDSAPANTTNLWKRVSADAIQFDKAPGGNDTAVANFNANNPYGETCRISGPFEAT